MLEFFVLGRLAARFGLWREAEAILSSLRRLRPDIPETTAYLAWDWIAQGRFDDARDVLEDYIGGVGKSCTASSLVLCMYATVQFKLNDPRWAETVEEARALTVNDGGGRIQEALLEDLSDALMNS